MDSNGDREYKAYENEFGREDDSDLDFTRTYDCDNNPEDMKNEETFGQMIESNKNGHFDDGNQQYGLPWSPAPARPENGWQQSPTNGRQPLRPILKTTEDQPKYELVYRSAPGGPYSFTPPDPNISRKNSSQWYDNFVEQTQRFDRTKGFSPKKNEKHVHFSDEDRQPINNQNSFGLGPLTIWDSMANALPSISDFGLRPLLANMEQHRADSENSPPGFTNIIQGLEQVWDRANDVNNRERDFFRYQWNQNAERFSNRLRQRLAANVALSHNNTLFGDPVWTTSNSANNSFISLSETGNKVQQLFKDYQKTIPKTPANYTWSGQLPRKSRAKTPIYSCKVFLGGIPYDLTDSDLHCTFAQFGHIHIQWPGKDIRSAIDGAVANKAGYVYIIFESYDNVSALLNACTISYRDLDSGCRWYFSVSSRRQKGKEVQVIPFDIGDRFYMKSSFSGQMEHSRTVFVGALHGMLSADGLAKVMDDLFSGVVFAGLDTDKYKYPLGSARVTFDNQDSYMKAISAAFVEIKSARFRKKIQIDPFIENEMVCTICRVQQTSPIFCRDEFLYFCGKCWEAHHSDPESSKHRPIIKNKQTNA